MRIILFVLISIFSLYSEDEYTILEDNKKYLFLDDGYYLYKFQLNTQKYVNVLTSTSYGCYFYILNSNNQVAKKFSCSSSTNFELDKGIYYIQLSTTRDGDFRFYGIDTFDPSVFEVSDTSTNSSSNDEYITLEDNKKQLFLNDGYYLYKFQLNSKKYVNILTNGNFSLNIFDSKNQIVKKLSSYSDKNFELDEGIYYIQLTSSSDGDFRFYGIDEYNPSVFEVPYTSNISTNSNTNETTTNSNNDINLTKECETVEPVEKYVNCSSDALSRFERSNEWHLVGALYYDCNVQDLIAFGARAVFFYDDSSSSWKDSGAIPQGHGFWMKW